MESTRLGHRDTMQIIQSILECVLKARPDTALKSHIIQYCNLKSSMADIYLTKLVDAEYLALKQSKWGERTIYEYEITDKGLERYKWFLKLNSEINL